METLKVGGRTYNIYWITGKVVGKDKYSTIRDNFFLLDLNGEEHAFQLRNFNVACREGHEMTVIWAVNKGKKAGPYIAVINHTTSEQYWLDDKNLHKMFKTHKYIFLFIPVLITTYSFMMSGNNKQYHSNLVIITYIIAFVIWFILSLIITGPILYWITKIKVRRFKSKIISGNYNTLLS